MARKFWNLLIKPSTISFVQEARRRRDYRLFDLIHGYIYARLPYLYIGIGTGEHPLVKVLAPCFSFASRFLSKLHQSNTKDAKENLSGSAFADGYHGKVVPLESISRLVMVNEDIQLTDLEQVIPYPKARDIILKNPDHILALECPCRSAREHPCLPLDVCLVIGEPFASFVSEHHPRRSRWISQQEAVEILRQEDERGHVHHAFFKDAMLGRYYAICNCCSCCCGAMQATRHGTPMLASSGYVCQVDEILCIGCGECSSSCQFGALSLGNDHSQVDQEKCFGCGVCLSKCEQGALSLRREPARGEPLEINELLSSSVR